MHVTKDILCLVTARRTMRSSRPRPRVIGYVLSEALTNATGHARVASPLAVEERDDGLHLSVRDEGALRVKGH